jgi:hypothetical protein
VARPSCARASGQWLADAVHECPDGQHAS